LQGDIPAINFANNDEEVGTLYDYAENPKLELVFDGEVGKHDIV
jgi:hypothetical protein